MSKAKLAQLLEAQADQVEREAKDNHDLWMELLHREYCAALNRSLDLRSIASALRKLDENQ